MGASLSQGWQAPSWARLRLLARLGVLDLLRDLRLERAGLRLKDSRGSAHVQRGWPQGCRGWPSMGQARTACNMRNTGCRCCSELTAGCAVDASATQAATAAVHGHRAWHRAWQVSTMLWAGPSTCGTWRRTACGCAVASSLAWPSQAIATCWASVACCCAPDSCTRLSAALRR